MNLQNIAQPDLFLSYASEDRIPFVDPLAKSLKNHGALIWYDQLAIRPGDSIVASIDRGLAEARCGAIVFSKNFFRKHWTHYELRGLVSRSVNTGARIIPIWLNITREEIAAASPSLADISAIQAGGRDPDELAVSIIEVVRPDIFESLQRKAAYKAMAKTSETRFIDPKALQLGPRRRDFLGDDLFARLELLQAALVDVFPSTLSEWHDNFCRDLNPDRELIWWEKLAAAHFRAAGTSANLQQRKAIFALLFSYFMDRSTDLAEVRSNTELNDDQKSAVLRSLEMARSEAELLSVGLNTPEGVRFKDDQKQTPS